MANVWRGEYHDDLSPHEFHIGVKRLSPARVGSPPASPVDNYVELERIVLQPETRPITQEQLVNEVKGTFFEGSNRNRAN